MATLWKKLLVNYLEEAQQARSKNVKVDKRLLSHLSIRDNLIWLFLVIIAPSNILDGLKIDSLQNLEGFADFIINKTFNV